MWVKRCTKSLINTVPLLVQLNQVSLTQRWVKFDLQNKNEMVISSWNRFDTNHSSSREGVAIALFNIDYILRIINCSLPLRRVGLLWKKVTWSIAICDLDLMHNRFKIFVIYKRILKGISLVYIFGALTFCSNRWTNFSTVYI